MVYITAFFTLLLHFLHHQPVLLHQQSPIRIPQLIVSPAEEVNSLSNRQHHTRSVSPSANLSANKIEETVKQVEAMIKSNPALPRLTRGEILDLLENITVTDQEKNRTPKSIMVVMPFTPSNEDSRNMEELYTKAPVTHIIGAEPFKANQGVVNNHPEIINRTPPKTRRRPTTQYGVEKTESTTPKPGVEQKVTVPPKQRRRRPELTTEKVSTTTTYRLRGRRRSTTTPVPITTTSATTTTKHPNHRYPEDEVTSEKQFVNSNQGGLRIIKPPKLSPPLPAHQQINKHIADLSVEENINQEVIVKQQIPVAQKIVKTTTPRVLINEIVKKRPIQSFSQKTTTPQHLISDLTPSSSTQKVVTTPKPLIDDINLPNNLKKVVQDLNLDAILSEEEIEAKYPRKTTPTTTPVVTVPSSTSTPDVSYVANNLSPEMQELLMSFGLIPNPNEPKPSVVAEEGYIPEKAEVKPESYVGFKPLPDDGPSREGMDALLASFGLGRSARKEKAIPTKKSQKEVGVQDNFEVVPEDYKEVLTVLGLREPKKIDTLTGNKGKILDKQHIFDPNTQYATDVEVEKLNKLISSIRKLEKLNRTATDAELKTIDMNNLKELLTTLNNSTKNLATLDEFQAPDPNKYYDNGLSKNEVKRQENTTSSTTTSTTTEESRSASLADLEASFGGQSSTEVSTEAAVETTTTPRTGFYYLVDWNTFLNIDDQKGRAVNLRFQPTIGDPKRFYSVNVP